MTPGDIHDEVKKLARQIYEGRKAMYETPPDWRPASLAQFPHLDVGFYDKNSAALVAEGFTCLADQENVASSRTWPEFQTVVRGFIGDGDTTTATIWHVRPLGRTRTLAIEGGRGTNVRAISFATEFDDGTFLFTNNIKGHDSGIEIPGVELQQLGQQAPMVGLLKVHRATVARRLECGAGRVRAVRTGSLEDIMASGRRYHALAAAHIRRIGYFDEERERKLWRDRLSYDVFRMLLRELGELSRADDRNADR